MKKRIILIILLFISIFTFSNERIKEYIVNINVNKDGTVLVDEFITYNPGQLNKRGLIRFIPYYYPNGKFLENKVAIKDFDVEYVKPLQRKVNFLEDKNRYNMVYRLGSKNEWLIQDQDYTYHIKYRMYNILRQNKDITQIYFNAIGNHWDMPIENAKIKINGINGDLNVYTGKVGETNKDFKLLNNEINITKTLQEGEGVSILLNSKDFKLSKSDIWKNRLVAYKSIFICLISIVISALFNIIAFAIKLKNSIKDRIMTEFDCFTVSPIMAKYIDKTYTYRDLMIVIYQLAAKDIIKYREKNPLHDNEEYVRRENEVYEKKEKKYNEYIEKQYYIDQEVLNQKYDSLSIYEKKVLDKLSLSKNDIFKRKKILAEAENILNNLVRKKYNEKYILPNNLYFQLFVIYLILNMLLLIKFFNNFDINIITLISLVIIIFTIVNLLTIKKYKKEYRDDYLRVKGFKKFLVNVEKKSFERFIEVNDLLRYFKDILPYALALGLENQYLILVNKAIQTYNLDKEYVYDNIMYYYLYDRYLFNNIINESFISEAKFTSSTSSFSGSFSSSGSSGGGFGGGGGSSW